MSNLTRINNNQITDAISGNIYFGINANTKVQPYSVTSGLLANNLTYGSDLTITGNLSVSGNVTAIDTTNITIEDPLLLLASNQTASPTLDIGYIGQRGTSNNIAFVWDESSTAFVTVYTDSGAGDNTTINILSYANLVTGSANVTGELLIAGNVSIGGNIVSPLNISGNITVGNIATTGQISSTGNITTANFLIGDGAYISNINAANVSATKISNGNSSANIGSVDSNLVITIANVLVSTFYNNGVEFTGDISAAGNVTANNVNAVNTVSSTGNVYGNNIGAITDISAGGNITGANFSTTGASGNITGANVIASTTLTATGNVYGGNLLTAGLVSALGNIQTGNFFIGDGAYISNINAANVSSTKISNGGSYANIASADGNLVIAVGASSNVVATFYDTGISFVGDVSTNAAINANSLSLSGNVTSSLNVTGNVTAQYIVATTDVSALGNIVANSAVNGNTLSLSGNVTSTLNVTGNIATGNITTPGIISSTGTVTAGNVSTAGFITATGNVSAGNLIAAANVSAVGGVYTGNVYSGNTISAAGNIITNQTFVGNALSGNTLIITSTSAGLQFSVTGNINAGNTWITNVPDPYAALDVANKQYVDSVAQGLDLKASVAYATAGNIFGSGYTYNNGASGVGATLTGAAVGNLTIDGTVVSAGERVLIKNEVGAFVNNTTQSAAFNGIYVVTTAGSPSVAYVLTRAVDFDIGTEMASSFTFVEYGSTQADTGWVCITNNPITVGTTQILWSQFSGAGQYTGGNAISVTGTVIDALYDGSTISRNGSNQLYIPANAPLVTPNIGDATGSSLSVTGSITGNVINATTFSVTGNLSAGNISVTNISLSGNVLGNLNVDNQITGNVINALTVVNTGNLSLTGNVTSTLNVTGNVISGNLVAVYDVSALGNVVSNNALNGNTLSLSGNVTSALNVTGNVTSSNLFTTASVSAAGNITGGNILTGGDVSASGNITGNVINATTVSASGNITGGNVLVGAGIISTSGNATVGNIDTSGQISALGNISTGNFFIGDGAYISNINAANVSSTKITNGGSYANIASVDGNLVIAVGTGSNVVATFYDQGVSLIGNVDTNASINANQLSLSGNVVSNLIVTTDVTANNFYGISTVSVGGNVISGNVSTGNVSASGNVLSGGNFSATGNVIAGNVLTVGEFSSTGNLTSGNILTAGIISSTGNIQSSTTFLVDTAANSVTLGANVTQTTGATLAINATDSMLLPVGNTAQRPGSPAIGMFRWNTSFSYLEVWNGSVWVDVSGSEFTIIQNEQFNGDGVTTAFTLGSSQTTDSCIVTINGIVQIPTTAYSVSGVDPTCVLTFTEAPVVGDTIDVREITTTTSVMSISNSSGNAVIGVTDSNANVAITGNLVVNSGNGFIYGDGTYLTNVGGGNVVASRIQSGNSQVNIASPGGDIYMAVGNSNVINVSATQITVTGNLNPNGNNTQSLGNSTNRWSNLWISGNTIFIGGSNITANATTLSFGGSPVVTQNANGNISGGNVTATTVSATGNITGNYFVGNGATLSSITGGNVTGTVANATYATSSGSATTAATVTGNAQANITSVGTLSSLSITGNTTGGNFTTAGTLSVGGITLSGNLIVGVGPTLTIDPNGSGGTDGNVVITGNLTVNGTTTTINSNTISTNDLQINMANNAANSTAANNGGIEVGPVGSAYATLLYNTSANVWVSNLGISSVGNISSGNLSVGTGTITTGNIVNSNGNAVGNIGSSSNYFNTIFAKATSALYADLAELYLADAEYAPGTVISFGGNFEVTGSVADGDARVAGIVSTNPSYLMNSGLTGENVVAVGLQGRVPCSVTGTVRKGDMLVSNGDGSARAEANPAVGTVIGKALADFDGEIGIIEVVVGIR